jgi:hypothetical protein
MTDDKEWSSVPRRPIVWTHLFLEWFGHHASWLLIKHSLYRKTPVNPKGRRNQKNSCREEQIARTNLKRSGFVFIATNLKF